MDYPSKDNEEIERLLMTLRPAPSDQFVDRTERRLLGRKAKQSRPRALVAALAVAGGLAVAVLIASLAGSGPLAPGGDTEVGANDDCRTVMVTVTQSVGELVPGANGQPRVVSTPRAVTKGVRRCR